MRRDVVQGIEALGHEPRDGRLHAGKSMRMPFEPGRDISDPAACAPNARLEPRRSPRQGGGKAAWRLGLRGLVLGLTVAWQASAANPAWPLAMLGDSDTHGFQDRIWMPEGRGGPYAASTFQWTEVLAQLRGETLDLGPRDVWGVRKSWARALDLLGVANRAPRKQDHRHNFAFAGASCKDLNTGVFRQAPRLREWMDRDPDRWQRGVVIVRIGITQLGYKDVLDQMATAPGSPALRSRIDGCVDEIRQAVTHLQSGHPQTRFVLVGLLNNADWPPYHGWWQTATATANIAAAIDRYDQALRDMAARDARIAFFDDRAWLAQRWGSRDRQGRPAYRTLRALPSLPVSMSQGDEPRHAVLSDGHAGLVWNVLWAQSLVALLRERFGVDVAPIEDAEAEAFVRRALALSPQVPPGGTR